MSFDHLIFSSIFAYLDLTKIHCNVCVHVRAHACTFACIHIQAYLRIDAISYFKDLTTANVMDFTVSDNRLIEESYHSEMKEKDIEEDGDSTKIRRRRSYRSKELGICFTNIYIYIYIYIEREREREIPYQMNQIL